MKDNVYRFTTILRLFGYKLDLIICNYNNLSKQEDVDVSEMNLSKNVPAAALYDCENNISYSIWINNEFKAPKSDFYINLAHEINHIVLKIQRNMKLYSEDCEEILCCIHSDIMDMFLENLNSYTKKNKIYNVNL